MKEFHSWKQIDDLVNRQLIPQFSHIEYDAILAITRGGMVPACLVSEALDVRNVLMAAVMFYTDVEKTLEEPIFMQFPSDALMIGKRILIVDDVWDSGKTAVNVRERVRRAGGKAEVAVIHYKPLNSNFSNDGPDYYALETSAWIVYPWDPDRGRLLAEQGITEDE